MQDTRTALPEGTRLYTSTGEIYTITGSNCGRGGNSIVYSAIRTNSERLFVIKECFPLSDNYLYQRNKTGLVDTLPADDQEALFYLTKCKQRMSRECELGQLIARKSGRAVAPWENVNVIGISMETNTVTVNSDSFIVMEQVSQKGCFIDDIIDETSRARSHRHLLRTSGLPDLFTICNIVSESLKALQSVHNAGYVFGDFQKNNIIFLDPHFELGDIGIGNLLDFECSRELSEGQSTAEITDDLYSTEGFSAPEIINHNDGHLRLTPASDVFSVGCLMLYLLKGRMVDANRLFHTNQFVDFREIEAKGGTKEAATYLNEILKQALKYNPSERFKDAYEMLEVVDELKGMCRQTAYDNIRALPTDNKSINQDTKKAVLVDDVIPRIHISEKEGYISFCPTQALSSNEQGFCRFTEQQWDEFSCIIKDLFSYLLAIPRTNIAINRFTPLNGGKIPCGILNKKETWQQNGIQFGISFISYNRPSVYNSFSMDLDQELSFYLHGIKDSIASKTPKLSLFGIDESVFYRMAREIITWAYPDKDILVQEKAIIHIGSPTLIVVKYIEKQDGAEQIIIRRSSFRYSFFLIIVGIFSSLFYQAWIVNTQINATSNISNEQALYCIGSLFVGIGTAIIVRNLTADEYRYSKDVGAWYFFGLVPFGAVLLSTIILNIVLGILIMVIAISFVWGIFTEK